MDFTSLLSSHPIPIILLLVGLLVAVSRAFVATRDERNASEGEVRKRVLAKDEDAKKEARLAAKLVEANINAKYPR